MSTILGQDKQKAIDYKSLTIALKVFNYRLLAIDH